MVCGLVEELMRRRKMGNCVAIDCLGLGIRRRVGVGMGGVLNTALIEIGR
jgi:hypothetical protein